GRDPQHASIAVTRGLLDKLDRTELEGVIAHELSHVGNRDIRVMVLVTVLVGTVALLADWMWRSFFWTQGGRRDRDRGGAGAIIAVIAIALAVLTPIIAGLIQLAVSRQREYLADASGALLTRYPPGLASALRKIAADKEPLSAGCATDDAVWVVSDGGGIGRFDRRLQHWELIDPTLRSLVAAACGADEVTAVGSFGRVLSIDDLGKTIRADDIGVFNAYALSLMPDGALVVGSDGTVLRQTAAGWSDYAKGITEDLYGVVGFA